MTARDRIIIVVVLVAAALAGFWFVGLAPKRKDAADLKSQIDKANQELTTAQQMAAQARQAKARYDADYADLATLGKAVPKNDALPSLLYQLQSAAHGAKIDFNSLKVTTGGPGAAPAPAAATAAVAKSNSPATPGSSPSSSGSTASSSGSPASGPTSPSTTSSVPATQAASTTLPPGALIGSAGFPTMPFSFVFNGTFVDMEQFIRDVQRFVRVDGDRVDVRGRLLSVDAFSLTAGNGGFPNVRASISATAYLRGPGDDAAPSSSTSSGSSSSVANGAATSMTDAEVR
jgi:Tfp pilus assembly protein PilO